MSLQPYSTQGLESTPFLSSWGWQHPICKAGCQYRPGSSQTSRPNKWTEPMQPLISQELLMQYLVRCCTRSPNSWAWSNPRAVCNPQGRTRKVLHHWDLAAVRSLPSSTADLTVSSIRQSSHVFTSEKLAKIHKDGTNSGDAESSRSPDKTILGAKCNIQI